MAVQFLMRDCLILEVRTGKTKERGIDFAVLKFLCNEDLNVYEIFCFRDSMAVALGLEPKGTIDLLLEVHPQQRNAGISVELVGVGSTGYVA